MDNASLNHELVSCGTHFELSVDGTLVNCAPALAGTDSSNKTQSAKTASASSQLSDVQQLNQDLQRVAAIAELLQHVCAAESVRDACEFLAQAVRRYSHSKVAAVGVIDKKSRCVLAGIATEEEEPVKAESRRIVEGALQEAAYREELLYWPQTDPAKRHGLAVQRQLVEAFGAERSVSVPLIDEHGSLRGVVIVLGNYAESSIIQTASFVSAAGVGLAESLRLLQRSHRTALLAWFDRFAESMKGSKRYVYMTGFVAAIMLACIPAPFKVHSDCRLEPVVKRYVSAPFDAVLDSTCVRPGDVVKHGQELARLDGDDLSLELDQAKAELHQAKKERAGHLASHDSGKAKLSELTVRRLEAKIELLEQRSSQLILTAPLDGIVVSGDLRSETGTPVKTGDGLFEIAPLDAMMVEILVPESQISYVRAGMPVALQFDALPFRTFSASIEHIHPRAEILDTENVFVAELKLENHREELRPGMHGRAKITGDLYPWIWNWIRRPTAAVANLLGY